MSTKENTGSRQIMIEYQNAKSQNENYVHSVTIKMTLVRYILLSWVSHFSRENHLKKYSKFL